MAENSQENPPLSTRLKAGEPSFGALLHRLHCPQPAFQLPHLRPGHIHTRDADRPAARAAGPFRPRSPSSGTATAAAAPLGSCCRSRCPAAAAPGAAPRASLRSASPALAGLEKTPSLCSSVLLRYLVISIMGHMVQEILCIIRLPYGTRRQSLGARAFLERRRRVAALFIPATKRKRTHCGAARAPAQLLVHRSRPSKPTHNRGTQVFYANPRGNTMKIEEKNGKE